MKHLLILLLLIGNMTVEAQTKFKIVEKETDTCTWRSIYAIVDENNKTIKVLDSTKYDMPLNGFEYGYFAVNRPIDLLQHILSKKPSF